MWDSESQRLGFKKCTRCGYALHELAFLVSFMAILFFFISGAMILWSAIKNTFTLRLLWLFPAALGVYVVAQLLYWCSWKLGRKRGFDYDYEKREASWNESGNRIVYKWTKG